MSGGFIMCTERLKLAEMRSLGCAPERLLWRKFLVIEGKILKPRILHHASVVISLEQTLRILSPAAITDPIETLDTG